MSPFASWVSGATWKSSVSRPPRRQTASRDSPSIPGPKTCKDTGQSWAYPEFKGYHRDLYWAQLETRELPITLVSAHEGTLRHLCTPRFPEDATLATARLPTGDISLLEGAAP